MTRYKHSIFTTWDNKKLFVQEWVPEKDPKAVILYVHGMGSHGGRLDHWAERFVNKNVAFVTYDQRGHGKSDEKRGHPKNVELMVDDLKPMVEQVRQEFPGIPLILYGHSLGGTIALNYVIGNTTTVDALITTSPWLKLVNPPSPAMVKIVKPLLKIAPGLTLSNGLDAKDISHDEEEVRKYREDPLVHDRISIGLFDSIERAAKNALSNIYKINCPYLIMHGTGDRITSHKTSEAYVMNTSNRTRLKLWAGAYHELHHEPEREEVFNYIIVWMKEFKLL